MHANLMADFVNALWIALLATGAYWLNVYGRWMLQRRAALRSQPGETQQIAQEIRNIIEDARRDLNARCVFVARYYNGDKFVGGDEIYRKARTHEAVRSGIAYRAEEYQGVLVTTLMEERALVDGDGPCWTSVKDLKPCKFKWLCEIGGVVSVARCAIRIDGRLVGFVGADFDAESHQHDGPILKQPTGIDRLVTDAFHIAQWIGSAR